MASPSKKNENEYIITMGDGGELYISEASPNKNLPDKSVASGATYDGLGPDYFVNNGLGGAPGQYAPSPADDPSKAKDLPEPKSQSADYVRTEDYAPKK